MSITWPTDTARAEHDGHGNYTIYAEGDGRSVAVGSRVDFDSAAAIIRWWREGGMTRLAAGVGDGVFYKTLLGVSAVPDLAIVKQPRAVVSYRAAYVGPDLPAEHADAVYDWLRSAAL